MADDITNTSTDEIAVQNKETASQQRIRELSDSVKLTAQERDEKDKQLKAEQDKNVQLEKENTFNSGFADVLGTYSAVKDHKDEIKEKVMKGYTVEDAALAVLGKAGKLGQPQTPVQVAGGSATTSPQSGQKEVKDMTLEEKRAILDKELVWQ